MDAFTDSNWYLPDCKQALKFIDTRILITYNIKLMRVNIFFVNSYR